MAHIVYGTALGNFGDPFLIMDFTTLHLTTKSATAGKFVDAVGSGYSFVGSGLTYGGGLATGGTLTSVTFFNTAGDMLATVTGGSFDAAAVTKNILQRENGTLLFAGNDQVDGSAIRDLIGGGAGNDTVHGGDGSDVILGMAGKDLLYGDKGADYFAFDPNKGADKIMDFADNDTRGDDVIVVSKANYANMTMTQSGNNVVLDFGGKGSLVIVGTTLDHIGADDFTHVFPVLG